MPLSNTDFEKVDNMLLQLLFALSGIESHVVATNVPTAGQFISEIARFRNEVALEIERQGSRD